MRASGWEQRLAAVIEQERERDDYHGRCVDFARRAVGALYGFDPMPHWRSQFGWSGSHWDTRKWLDAAFLEGQKRFGWHRCGRGEIHDGDIALIHAPRTKGSGMMVVAGAKVLMTAAHGLRATGLRYADEFWSV